MAIEKVQLGVTAIQDLLNNGYTWLKKDDLGYGSIQEKFQASDIQIATIRKHPLLKDLETTARVFVIVDDTKDGATTSNTIKSGNGESLESISGSSKGNTGNATTVFADSNQSTETSGAETEADSFSAFANL